MPGWYVHMEGARKTAQRLRDGDIPSGFPIDVTHAREMGEICYTWRNYLAIGSVGPDMFYLLPDFSNKTGVVIRNVMKWVLEVWGEIDEQYVTKWEKWITPASTNNSQLASQLTGGLSNQIGQVLDELSAAVVSALEGLVGEMGDWFGLLTSGVPQGVGTDAFYWSDVFHYRRTYQFPYTLYRNAVKALGEAANDDERHDAEAQIAFSIGWMSHCAVDVTGHPFTNAKSGGPYRDHWQRHHLVENHMDSECYSANHSGQMYGEYGTGALHFWVAFRPRAEDPYSGRADGPAFDYFSGLPAYDISDGPTGRAQRAAFFNLPSGPLPQHLIDALLQAMVDVHPDGPKILKQEPAFSATGPGGTPDGRPNTVAMGEMWSLVYGFLKMSGSDGLSPTRPQPPQVITDHSFPRPPGSNFGIDSDPNRGADIDGDGSFTLLDFLLALFAWIVYIAQIITWLVTVLPGLIIDIATFPAREVIYWAVEVPAWNIFLLARRALVMAGFLVPKPDEIDTGLTTLGSASGSFNLSALLDDPAGTQGAGFVVTEPSGRATDASAFGLDPAYPRNIVRDLSRDITRPDLLAALTLARPLQYAGDGGAVLRPSEWVSPWRYPLVNQGGVPVMQEGGATHVGPFVVGDTASKLLPGPVGHRDARTLLEGCATPAATFGALNALLPQNRHLGGPVDYGLYLIGRMVSSDDPDFPVPDFNMDADRGYAWRCWDWDRHHAGPDTPSAKDPPVRGRWECVPDFKAAGKTDFHYRQPCTPPQFFHAAYDNPRRVDPNGQILDNQWYDPSGALHVHYLGRPAEHDPPRGGSDPCDGPQEPAHLPAAIDALPWDVDLGRVPAPRSRERRPPFSPEDPR